MDWRFNTCCRIVLLIDYDVRLMRTFAAYSGGPRIRFRLVIPILFSTFSSDSPGKCMNGIVNRAMGLWSELVAAQLTDHNTKLFCLTACHSGFVLMCPIAPSFCTRHIFFLMITRSTRILWTGRRAMFENTRNAWSLVRDYLENRKDGSIIQNVFKEIMY
jgi:hypothetical protein